ncbi:hypothetical protein FBY06_14039 [Pseudomonas sp. SJZ085]|uniref:hypothetical protein n=1 Tax=unclassified Pseudomonas TaxID=196821 RepID=UPI001199C547|nr:MULTISPECIES: hypothetical protein [unclassified Pseudomonas]TWC12035.1 hypothetical protein FBX99_13939 [Pseudomonas sp. SJZ074]TWC30616.1 hypothetical protein FBY06_14039 [Pseudomonas sp. SJZ085]
MSFAHIGEIKEVSDFMQANELIEAGAELLAIVPGWTSDSTPCTLFYLGQPKVKKNPLEGFKLGKHVTG